MSNCCKIVKRISSNLQVTNLFGLSVSLTYVLSCESEHLMQEFLSDVRNCLQKKRNRDANYILKRKSNTGANVESNWSVHRHRDKPHSDGHTSTAQENNI